MSKETMNKETKKDRELIFLSIVLTVLILGSGVAYYFIFTDDSWGNTPCMVEGAGGGSTLSYSPSACEGG